MSTIFISYRRADSRLVSSRIYDRIADAFGKQNVFKDIDNIPPGKDFRGVLREATSSCQIMLVIIGPDWLDIRDKVGNRRLDNPNDFVRIEVETGLQRDGTLVIPVLVESAEMPSATALPDSLKELAYNNAFRVGDDPHFHHDMDTLISHIRRHLTGTSIPKIDWRWLIGVVLVPIIVALIGFISQNPNILNSGANGQQASTTTQVAQLATTQAPSESQEQGLSQEDIHGTGAAQAYATLTALAPTNTPTITPTPSDTPISSSDIQKTAQAEVFATASSAAETQAIIAQETQNAVLTEQFIAGATATYIAQLSLTPPATATLSPTNTPVPPIATNTPDMPEAEQLALTGVTSNAEWKNLVGDSGYMSKFKGVDMVLVPAGCFVMGNDSNAYYWNNSSFNYVQDVPDGATQCFDPFWADKTEVTQADFERLGGEQARSSNFSGDNRPVEDITWFEARDFCALRGGRLPTETEWEYVARGPDELYFPWGNDWEPNNVIWNRSSSQGTADVGSILAGSSWVGALDMSGNVWEWTRSVYEDYPYMASDGRENDYGNKTYVLYSLRGGSWGGLDSGFFRSATRYGYDPTYWFNFSGFRCVLSYE